MAQATSILTGDIMGQAHAFREARSHFDEEFMDWARGIPPLAPEHFWPMVAEFREVLLKTMQYRKEGYVKAAANEFMRLAVVNASKEIGALVKTVSYKLVYDGIPADQALNLIGNFFVGHIVKSIKSGEWAPNSPITIHGTEPNKDGKQFIQGKGFDRPLIDTGNLFQSASYQIT
jgi:hypothetical protein